MAVDVRQGKLAWMLVVEVGRGTRGVGVGGGGRTGSSREGPLEDERKEERIEEKEGEGEGRRERRRQLTENLKTFTWQVMKKKEEATKRKSKNLHLAGEKKNHCCVGS